MFLLMRNTSYNTDMRGEWGSAGLSFRRENRAEQGSQRQEGQGRDPQLITLESAFLFRHFVSGPLHEASKAEPQFIQGQTETLKDEMRWPVITEMATHRTMYLSLKFYYLSLARFFILFYFFHYSTNINCKVCFPKFNSILYITLQCSAV